MQKKQGQIGLILLVVMALVISLALTLGARSLSDTVLSRQETESAKAFRVAENGVEQAMNEIRQGNLEQSIPVVNEGIFSGNVGLSGLTEYGLYVKEGEQAYLDLTGFDASNNLTISWTKLSDQSENRSCVGDGSGNAPAAIEIISVIGDGDSVKFNYYNPASCTIAGNGFTNSSSGGETYRSQVSFDVAVGTTAVKIRPLYSNATITATGSNLATQLYLIESKAEGGDTKKEIQVKRGLDAPPSVFDFALFSGTTIVK